MRGGNDRTPVIFAIHEKGSYGATCLSLGPSVSSYLLQVVPAQHTRTADVSISQNRFYVQSSTFLYPTYDVCQNAPMKEIRGSPSSGGLR